MGGLIMAYISWKCPKCREKNEVHYCSNCESENPFKRYYTDIFDFFTTFTSDVVTCKKCKIIFRSVSCECGCVYPVKKCDLL